MNYYGVNLTKLELDHLPASGGVWVCGCPTEAHGMAGEADDCRLREFRQSAYVVEPLAVGWYCRNPECGVFNGDEKVFLTQCRSCGSDRPMVGP